ncbi:hypothetical protein [Arthrobacter ruber]|uniref:hypothetical protein n=1 Tax=Arthrobacter ruber TaxID=1258893 RepID=UPI000CF54A7B|nr:hypothetical protein [Arthrobacter ruber]
MHHPSPAVRHGGSLVLFVVVAACAAVAQLGVGYLSLISGLAAPPWAVALFLGWWAVMTYIGVRLMLHRSYWVLLVPAVSLATLFSAMVTGGAVLGWRA